MSRHRDVRSMNYTDEYDGYDDVYGHSVEDDYCVSPSAEQFMFDRNKSANMSSFFTEPDILEANEEEEEVAVPSSYKLPELTDLEAAKLMSCVEAVKNVIGETLPESELNKKIIEFNYNTEAVLNSILNDETRSNQDKQPAEKDLVEAQSGSKFKKYFNLSSQLVANQADVSTRDKMNSSQVDSKETSSFNSLADLAAHNLKLSEKKPGSGFAIPKMTFKSQKENTDADNKPIIDSDVTSSFSSLADLTAHHLKISVDKRKEGLKNIGSPSSFIIPNISSKNTQSSTTEAPTFKSLADLRAHHLTISSGSESKSEEKDSSSPSGFIIPSIGSKDAKSGKFNIPSFGSPPSFSVKTEKNVGSTPFVFPQFAVKVKEEKIDKDEMPKISKLVLEDISNLNCEEKFDPNKVIKTEGKAKADMLIKVAVKIEKAKCDKQPSKPSESTLEAIRRECALNLARYPRKAVSAFGKVLCKKYERKTPYQRKESVKVLENSLDHFDFSSPSPDMIVLMRLRRTTLSTKATE